MAIFLRGKTRCAICDRLIEDNDERFSTSTFLEKTHPLWRYADDTMHASCYMGWDRRAEFASEYCDSERRWFAGHPDCSLLMETANILVVYGSRSVAVMILLKLIAVLVDVGLDDLDDWLSMPADGQRFVQAELDRVRADLDLLGGKDHILDLLRSLG